MERTAFLQNKVEFFSNGHPSHILPFAASQRWKNERMRQKRWFSYSFSANLSYVKVSTRFGNFSKFEPSATNISKESPRDIWLEEVVGVLPLEDYHELKTRERSTWKGLSWLAIPICTWAGIGNFTFIWAHRKLSTVNDGKNAREEKAERLL